jgi:hypothetical protein
MRLIEMNFGDWLSSFFPVIDYPEAAPHGRLNVKELPQSGG